jgi:hypothetical protein
MRTNTSSKTIENHCHRERFNRSSLLVRENRVRGVIALENEDLSRARIHATAKNPDINNSTSRACALIIPPAYTRFPYSEFHRFAMNWFYKNIDPVKQIGSIQVSEEASQ